MLIRMNKGDLIVCNAMIIHAGYGYGVVPNIRFHLYLWNRLIHLHALYDVDESTEESILSTTSPGSECTVKFNEYIKKYNKLKISSDRVTIDTKTKRVKTIVVAEKKKRERNITKNLIPGRKGKKTKFCNET